MEADVQPLPARLRPAENGGPPPDAPTPVAGGGLTDVERRLQARSVLWHAARTLYRGRWFVFVVTVLVTGAAVAISLNMPNWYAASARVLLPAEGSSGLGSLIGTLSPISSSFLGGSGAKDYNRYLAILSSRSLLEETVERFDLVRVYGTADEETPEERALERLRENLSFEVDLQYFFMTVTALDTDPRRAADLTNFLVAELNRRNQTLLVQNAATFRAHVQTRYENAAAELDSLRGELQRFQEATGVVELPTMTQAMMTSLAAQRGQVVQAEIQYEALLAQYGPENPQVEAAREVMEAARRAQADLMAGRDEVLPVPMRRLPAVGSEYARLYQEVLIQGKILETTRPLYEQARFEEERDRVAVQVLDPAVPPSTKAKPRRSILVATTALSALLLSALFLLAYDWLRRNRAEIARQLRAA